MKLYYLDLIVTEKKQSRYFYFVIFQSESRKRIYLAKVDMGAEEHDSRNFLIKKILSYNVAIAF